MSKGIEGDFFGKEEPNGADFANFGILRSMQGLNGFDIVESHELFPDGTLGCKSTPSILIANRGTTDCVMLTSCCGIWKRELKTS